MFIDTHAHLYLNQFQDDIDDVILRAKDNHVEKIFLPNIDCSTIDALHELSDNYPNICYPMMGLHPCSVKENYKEELNLIDSKFQSKKYYGVGETGIDLYWDTSFKNEQIEAFEIQIEMAKQYGLPIIIHSRDSLDLTIEVIAKNYSDNLRGIFHCFNGTIEQAKRILDLNFHMGIGGVTTFKNAKMDDVLRYIPIENMVLETDAPYLSPVPYRGQRNESSYLPLIAEKLALVKSVAVEEIKLQTTLEAKRLFGL